MIEEICKKAKGASMQLAQLQTEEKNDALEKMAKALEANIDKILEANKKDVDAAKAKGLKSALLDRLALDKRKIGNMTRCLREVAALPDPVGSVVSSSTRPNGLIIRPFPLPLRVRGSTNEI